ncbi:MAG TPA: hypothetical protein VF669_16635 [Tepidisphaeraceae bacterium]|jgi:hypothetical protein
MTGEYFQCEKCERRFPFNPQMAGKKVKCKCGYVFVPQVRQVRETPADGYDLAPDEPMAAKPVGTVPAPVDQSPVLAYAHKPPAKEAEVQLEKAGKFRTIYLPVGLIVLGIGLRAGQMFLPSAGDQSPLALLGMIVGRMVLNVILMFCAVMIAAQVLGADFGDARVAALKLAGMSIVGGAAASFVTSLDWHQGGIQGPVIALHLLILIYFAGFSTFFELDLQESLFTVVIVMFFQTAAFCIAFNQIKI